MNEGGKRHKADAASWPGFPCFNAGTATYMGARSTQTLGAETARQTQTHLLLGQKRAKSQRLSNAVASAPHCKAFTSGQVLSTKLRRSGSTKNNVMPDFQHFAWWIRCFFFFAVLKQFFTQTHWNECSMSLQSVFTGRGSLISFTVDPL